MKDRRGISSWVIEWPTLIAGTVAFSAAIGVFYSEIGDVKASEAIEHTEIRKEVSTANQRVATNEANVARIIKWLERMEHKQDIIIREVSK